MEIVPAVICISVGVSEARITVGGTGVCVAVVEIEIGVKVGVSKEDGAVGKTLTEKLQALSNKVDNTKTMIDRNHLRCFIAFSLSAAGWWLLNTYR